MRNAKVDEFPATIAFPDDERAAVAYTIAAAESSHRLVRTFADVFLNPAQRPTKRNRRRPSIKRIMKDAKEVGFNIEIAPDGTTRLIAKTENSDNSDVASDRNEWDELA